ncbi:MAG: DUF512 domain-containing protein, partial [Vicinamibacterales bacterium]
LAGRELPSAEFYGEFAQIENGVGSVTHLRLQLAQPADLPRLDGRRIAVVTGTAMASIMPELLDGLVARTGAHFELIPMVNSLFGPTTTTAGLLVGSDIRAALGARYDVDVALIPAETINENGVFLDDDTLVAVREAVPMPVLPSYDFVDALSGEAQGVRSIGADAA